MADRQSKNNKFDVHSTEPLDLYCYL